MIDTLYTLKSIPVRASIRDSIMTNTTLSGGLDIDGIDSLNLVLSGTPSVNVIMPTQLDGTTIVAIISIIANIIIVGITFYSKKWLQKHETEEIRTRTWQDIALKQQAKLYELLVEINDLQQSLAYACDAENILYSIENKDLNEKISYAKLFLSKNSLFMTDELEQIAYEVLELYTNTKHVRSFEVSKTIEFKLWQYSCIYKVIDVSETTNLINDIENVLKDE